jgi:hypothetical protein
LEGLPQAPGKMVGRIMEKVVKRLSTGVLMTKSSAGHYILNHAGLFLPGVYF